jgi:hypothetical protein
MRIGIDLDGVLAEFDSNVTRIANTFWPGRLPEGYTPSDWNFDDKFSKSEWSQIWEEIKSTRNFWYKEEPYTENVEALKNFINSSAGYEVDLYFITSRVETIGSSVLVQSAQWLAKYGLFPNRSHSTVIPVADSKRKGDVLSALKIPIMIDDYDDTVRRLQGMEGTEVYLLDRPWNRHAKDLDDVRLSSLKDYLALAVETATPACSV